jgi:predicted phage baseplate assembly protein
VQSEELELAETPLADDVGQNEIVLDRVVGDLPPLQTLVVRGKLARVRVTDKSDGLPLAADDDPFVSELATLDKAVLADPDHTLLKLRHALANLYDRTTVTVNANVARATHGETVTEVLGSGDAGQPFQRFLLRQPPLTYVSASNSSGAESTLRIHVNDLEWHEVPTLYGRQPSDRVFVTRTSDEGRTTVQFGDGLTGARLPSGQENVRASYRKGIGLDGLVQAEQLSLLMTRPLGVKSVVNPAGATGAADRESLDDARDNAPLAVLTLDRIVSLQDYEDFTRAYAGIAKALATRTWDGRTRGVFLTVAGPGGAAVPADSDLHRHLRAALAVAGDPNIHVRVQSFRDVRFRIKGGFRVHPDFVPDKVKAEVDRALLQDFSFAARSFGQSVALSHVIAVIQAVPGVVMVDVDDLRRTTGAGLVHDRLPASMPSGDLAAELLTLDPVHLDELKVTA